MRALSQFAVPQYFSSNGQAEAGDSIAVSQYLGPQAQTAVYHEENPLARSTAAPSFSATMTGFNPLGTAEGVEQQQEPMPESSSLENTYSQYQQALRVTFDYTRAGRLLDASRSLLEISEWLIGNARELGTHASRLIGFLTLSSTPFLVMVVPSIYPILIGCS
jgi:hypothetical protein